MAPENVASFCAETWGGALVECVLHIAWQRTGTLHSRVFNAILYVMQDTLQALSIIRKMMDHIEVIVIRILVIVWMINHL
jgi:hypothetical protein